MFTIDCDLIVHEFKIMKYMGVLRDTARAPQPPITRAPNEPARPICAQESIFWAKFCLILAKNPNFYGRKQKFWYPHNGRTT